MAVIEPPVWFEPMNFEYCMLAKWQMLMTAAEQLELLEYLAEVLAELGFGWSDWGKLSFEQFEIALPPKFGWLVVDRHSHRPTAKNLPDLLLVPPIFGLIPERWYFETRV